MEKPTMTMPEDRVPPINTSSRWPDGANLVLAIWLFISPWVLQFGSDMATAQPGATAGTAAAGAAAWNAWVLGVLIFLSALSAITIPRRSWQDWATLILGAWVFVAPWVLGFATVAYGAAAWDHWITGALVFLFSLLGFTTMRGPGLRFRRTGEQAPTGMAPRTGTTQDPTVTRLEE
jgi:hypothetical protein